jgi:hypothetical protein
MLRQTLVVLGIGAVVAGYSSTAYAQSIFPSSSDNNTVTLSGESLRTVESRRINNDFPTFFNGTLPTTPSNSVTNIGRLTTSDQSPLIGDQPVDVVVGDTLNPELPLTAFPSTGDAGDSDRVKVQVQLGNQ